MDRRFYGYKHWTLEDHPRCFYVGKGLVKRPYDNRRSSKWRAVIERHGLRVEVCIGPVTNEEACAWEIQAIASEGTYCNDYSHTTENIGCNFTKGGDGVEGRRLSANAKDRIGSAQRGKPKSSSTKQLISAALRGRTISAETRQKMSDAKLGKALSDENRRNLWKNRSRQFSEQHKASLSRSARSRRASVETRQKMSDALKGRHHKCGNCGEFGHSRLTCERRNHVERSKTSDRCSS